MGGSAAAYCGHGWTGRLRFTTVPSYILHLNSLSFADLDCISFLSGMPLLFFFRSSEEVFNEFLSLKTSSELQNGGEKRGLLFRSSNHQKQFAKLACVFSRVARVI